MYYRNRQLGLAQGPLEILTSRTVWFLMRWCAEKEVDILQQKSDIRNSVPKANQDDSKTLSSDDPETSSHYTEQETRPSDVSRPMKRRSPIGAHEDQVNH